MGGRITRLVPWTLLLRGDRVECPCCGGRFRRFRPRGSRRDAECPRCRSLERHRVMWLYLERETGLFRDSLDVLHVAPEPWLERRLRGLPRIRYVGGDLRPTGEQVRLDLTAVPYPDASFDLAICAHVLDEIPDDRLAMRELRRVLRPGGALVLQTPIDESRE